MIDQLIKKYLQEYEQRNTSLILKEEKSQSGWKIELLDYKSIKNQRAVSQAQNAGAQSGLVIIATKNRKAATNDSLIETDIKRILEKNDVSNTGYPFKAETHLYILAKVKDKEYKKVWNLWVVDKRTSGINEVAKQIKQEMQSTKYYVTISKHIDRLQGLTLMNPNEADSWFKFLNERKDKLKIKTSLKLPNLRTLKNDVSSDASDTITSQKVKIDYADKGAGVDIMSMDGKIILTNQQSIQFVGEALMSISADGESITYEPVKGMITLISSDGNQTGIFTGDFINGAPANGMVRWAPDVNSSEMVIEFAGKLVPTISTKLSGRQSTTLLYDDGVAKYNNGLVFKGTWKRVEGNLGNEPKDGDMYNKENKLIGKYKNGEYKPEASSLEIQKSSTEDTKEIPKTITYPFNWDIEDNKTWTIFNDGNMVYYFDDAQGVWTAVSKIEFENKIKTGDEISFIPINNEDEQTKLDKLFGKQHKVVGKKVVGGGNNTTKPPAKKTKYVVVKDNVNSVNLYFYVNNEFKTAVANSRPENKDKTTGYKLLGTKTATINDRFDNKQYTMYLFSTDGKYYYIPSTYAKIVER